MTVRLMQVYVGKARHMSGKTVNVYDSYANALSHGATGLSTIYEVDKSDGSQGDAITQVAKTTGLTVDESGMIHFHVDDGAAVFLMSNDQWGPPRRIVPA